MAIHNMKKKCYNYPVTQHMSKLINETICTEDNKDGEISNLSEVEANQ